MKKYTILMISMLLLIIPQGLFAKTSPEMMELIHESNARADIVESVQNAVVHIHVEKTMRNMSGNAYFNNPFDQFNEDFFNQGNLGVVNTNVANNLRQQMSSPRAMGAEDIGIPERRGILDFLKAGGAKVRDTLLQGAGATGGLNIGARLGMLVNPALAIPGALAGAFFGSKVTEMGPSGSFYAGLTDEQQEAVDEIYGPGGIMQGYNPISMFGRGATGAIDKRRAGIMRALEKRDSEILQQRLDDLQAARDRITGTIRDASGRITGGTGQGTIDSGNEGGYGGTG